MRTGPARLVLDPYEWLPPDGEEAISVRYSGLTLEIVVRFDDPSGTGERERTLRFEDAVGYSVALFPGLGFYEFGPPDVELIGKLVEYPQSEVAEYWNSRSKTFGSIRHFSIPFLSAEQIIHVFARDAVLS